MKLTAIVAVSENNVIGKNNRLIWHLPSDMKFFREKTMGHCVITGRKNYESIPEKYRPLPGRTNILVSRQKDYPAPGTLIVHSPQEAVEKARLLNETEAFIIGGAEIFRELLPVTDKLYLTRVHASFDGDVFFPKLNRNEWKEISRTEHPADEKNPYSFTILEYERTGN